MIRSSKHRIDNITNKSKLNQLDNLFNDYKICLLYYIDLIINGDLPLKTNLSSKLLPDFNIKHSRYKQLIYKQASEIIRSQIKKSTNKRFKQYKKIYFYFKKNNRQVKFTNKKFTELNIKNIVQSKYFTKPNLNNLTINLDERFFNIKNSLFFDKFINIKLPYFNDKGTRSIQLNLPLKHHKHSNKLIKNGFELRKNIQLKMVNNMIFLNLIWFKEESKKVSGYSLGIDLGYKKLITTSTGDILGKDMLKLYDRISKKKQGSKNFNQLLIHRDNLINYYVNKLNVDNVNLLIIEDLNSVKQNSKGKLSKKINNKLQRWSYIKTIDKLERICQEQGIELVKVSPAYTSQTCSKCGIVDKNSRNLEEFKCISCGYEIDADVNASINILNRGTYSSSNIKKDKCHNLS